MNKSTFAGVSWTTMKFMLNIRAIGLCALLFDNIGQAAENTQGFSWPNHAKAAVSLAYDDALNSQLDHAIPALDRYHFKGSFYLLLANESLRERLPEWRAAAAHGHELGNHTLFHQCSRSLAGHEWVQPHRDLEKISVAQLRD